MTRATSHGATAKPVAKRRRAARGSGEQLRTEIVAAAKKLLAETEHADDVSIRAVADAVGVTAPSIYLHFADKDALITAVISEVFAELDQAMLDAAASATSPLERLCGYGLAYVRFAIARPEEYRLATMDACHRPDVDDVLRDSAFVHLVEAVQECMDAGVFAAGDPVPIALDLWAAGHGLAALVIAKPFVPWGDVEEVAYRVLVAAALGHAAAELVGPDRTPAAVTAWILAQRERHDAG